MKISCASNLNKSSIHDILYCLNVRFEKTSKWFALNEKNIAFQELSL